MPEEDGQPYPEPPRALRGSVFGQVSAVNDGMAPLGQTSEPVVNLRLERHDPHVGLAFVTTVRLRGSDAIGFAHVGDWVEAAGRKRSAHLLASRCVNHSTGASYSAGARHRVGLALTLVALVVVGVIMVLAIVILADARDAVDQESRQFIEECIRRGASRSVCEDS